VNNKSFITLSVSVEYAESFHLYAILQLHFCISVLLTVLPINITDGNWGDHSWVKTTCLLLRQFITLQQLKP